MRQRSRVLRLSQINLESKGVKMAEKMDTRLLEPGWAGVLTLEEARFIQQSLRADRMLRRSWHIRGRSCPLSKIAERAFPENPEKARQHILNEMSAANRRQKIADGQNIENLDSDKKDTVQKDTISPQLTLDLSIMGV